MSPYAEKTKVPTSRSRDELERLLRVRGAKGFAFSWDTAGDRVEFLWKELRVRFILPRVQSRPGLRTSAGLEQAERRRWRALILVVKAKLEAVESGIAIFEEEFLSYLVDERTNRTVGEHVLPRIAAAEGHLRLLPGDVESAPDEGRG